MTLSDYNPGSPSLKTAQQVLELFYDHYSVDKIKLVLLEVFQGYALNDKAGFLDLDISEQEVSEVFDGLIELIVAVQTLMEEGKVEGVKI
ncbi:hypothetical protein H9N25_12995 [Pedobacter riviphilus]|uniref:Uncharacterized protein n=1 Tax=Pedobacter riviphilus TaxID=2766984 RepID=A0ABX6TI22_9SPHI|nr:hypothetical protein [Pedobacter riviphilus]QNR82905.1 hypothetical protein H9N25_12995 [Pedobacter riviphilus]